MSEAVEAVVTCATVLRHIATTTGDLPLFDLNAAQNGLAEAKIKTVRVMQEGVKARAAATAFMRNVNGPATLEDFQAAIMDIEAKAAAWNGRLATALADMTGPECLWLGTRGQGQMSTRHVVQTHFIPARVANPLRQSAELAALVAAFTELGA